MHMKRDSLEGMQLLAAEAYSAVLRIRIRMFLGLLDPDPVIRGIDPDLDTDPSITKQK